MFSYLLKGSMCYSLKNWLAQMGNFEITYQFILNSFYFN